MYFGSSVASNAGTAFGYNRTPKDLDGRMSGMTLANGASYLQNLAYARTVGNLTWTHDHGRLCLSAGG